MFANATRFVEFVLDAVFDIFKKLVGAAILTVFAIAAIVMSFVLIAIQIVGL